MIQYETKESKEDIYALWQTVFQDPEPFAEYYFHWVYPKNQVLTIRQEGRLCSMLHLNPYTWVWNYGTSKERLLKLHYIVGVATDASCRRRGFMSRCMKRALQDLEAAGEPFTYLMPARKEYYEPFQFVTITEERRWKKNGEHWVLQPENGKNPVSVRKSPIADREHGWEYIGFPIRDYEYRNQRKAEVRCEDGDILEWADGRNYCAYILNQNSKEPTVVVEQVFTPIQESEDGELFFDVWKNRLEPEWHRRHGRTGIEYIESQPMMLRILDLVCFVELLPYEKKETRTLIQLTDPICKNNNGFFLLTLSSAGCRLIKMEAGAAAEIGLPIQHWNIQQLTVYLLEETQLGDQIYLMEIV